MAGCTSHASILGVPLTRKLTDLMLQLLVPILSTPVVALTLQQGSDFSKVSVQINNVFPV